MESVRESVRALLNPATPAPVREVEMNFENAGIALVKINYNTIFTFTRDDIVPVFDGATIKVDCLKFDYFTDCSLVIPLIKSILQNNTVKMLVINIADISRSDYSELVTAIKSVNDKISSQVIIMTGRDSYDYRKTFGSIDRVMIC